MTTWPASAVVQTPQTGGLVSRWVQRHAELGRVWQSIVVDERRRTTEGAAAWSGRIALLQEEQQDLARNGRWRGGPRTLLAALGAQYNELAMTAGLAWLLRPDGHHGVGPAVLDPFLKGLGVPSLPLGAPLRIVREEIRTDSQTQRDTRADLVLYGPGWTVLVEAKVFAAEQPQQLDRLHALWREEPNPVFVYLTRGRRAPITAVDSQDAWLPLTWEQVATLVRAAIKAFPRVAPGVLDYVATLEAYHRD